MGGALNNLGLLAAMSFSILKLLPIVSLYIWEKSRKRLDVFIINFFLHLTTISQKTSGCFLYYLCELGPFALDSSLAKWGKESYLPHRTLWQSQELMHVLSLTHSCCTGNTQQILLVLCHAPLATVFDTQSGLDRHSWNQLVNKWKCEIGIRDNCKYVIPHLYFLSHRQTQQPPLCRCSIWENSLQWAQARETVMLLYRLVQQTLQVYQLY